ncbi:hypothetical protein P886_0922 [Alteromonadaceae bacterium 2753L.S.0a.02]|nr:hypothetical protein P886_0922 [Alteromonadaceae bacterium 2753L.S.0a.02]
MRTSTVVILAIFVLSSCSNRAIYDTVQANQRADCQQRPPSQEEDCLAQHQDSFAEYTEKRNEALKK